MSICVVGAGVIGLTCVDQILDSQLNLHTITLISEYYPSDTPISSSFTSPWAGAHFRPSPYRADNFAQDKLEEQYAGVTYEYFKRQSEKWLKEACVEFMDGIEWLENPSNEYITMSEGYNEDNLEDFTIEQDLPDNVKVGFKYKTWCLNAPEYLMFLFKQISNKCRARDVSLRVNRVRLDKLSQVVDLYPDVELIVNASGKGLQWTGGFDPKTYAIRGQTLLLDVLDVTNSQKSMTYDKTTITHQDKDGNWTFVIKRPGKAGSKARYILGGTKQPGDYTMIPREQDTKDLISRGKRLFPELLESFEIVNVNVGFRPARKGGSRVELETQTLNSGFTIPIVHVYGFGGFGFQASVGAAKQVLKLIEKSKLRSKL